MPSDRLDPPCGPRLFPGESKVAAGEHLPFAGVASAGMILDDLEKYRAVPTE
jgi:hypothetical protein